jgi:hypothetical protein
LKPAHSIALVSPHHDPQGRLLDFLKPRLKKLQELFDVIAISVSKETDSRVKTILEESGAHVHYREENGHVAQRYMDALKIGLEDGVDHFLLLDFDGALHWVEKDPDEFSVTIDQIKNSDGLISIARTPEAFATYPDTQKLTEKIFIEMASQLVGKRVDPGTGAYGMDKKVAEVLVTECHRNDFGYYGEVLAVAHRHKFPIQTIEARGEDWETPEQFKNEIHKVGYEKWLQNFQSLEEWEKRLTLAFETGKVLARG